jgi:HK97 gp10 family phage protein
MGKFYYYVGGQTKEMRKALGDIGKYGLEVQGKLGRLIEKTAEDIAQDAKSRVNVHTGNLRQSIRAEHYKNAAHPESVVKTEVRYSHLVEFGTDAHIVAPKNRLAMTIGGSYRRGAIRIPEQRPRPFLEPAYDEGVAKMLKKAKEILKK